MKNTKLFAAIMLLTIAFTACNQGSKMDKFVLKGTLEGINQGKAILVNRSSKESKSDTAIIENGKFTFTGNYAEPTRLTFIIDGEEKSVNFYAENSTMTLTGNVDTLYQVQITGGQAEAEYKELRKAKGAVSRKYNVYKLIRELGDKKITVKRHDEIIAIIAKSREEAKIIEQNFIKENSKSPYSAILIGKESKGKSAKTIESMLNGLDASLASNSIVVNLRKKVEQMKNEVSINQFVSNASDRSYKVDKTFNGKNNKDVIYLGVFKNDNICILQKGGIVSIINAKGQKVSSFKPNINGYPCSIAVDNADNIYVMSILKEKIVKKIRGKAHTQDVHKGIGCTVFNKKGVLQNKFKLSGIISATGARVVDNKLMVSDWRNKIIGIFDAKTGKMVSKIDGMRPCCMILDFSVNDKKEILVANLGAFRVQSYDFTGKSLVAFGQRGTKINDFKGCCNPVSVAYLSNGAIVTAEKSPTRVKIYSKEGAKQIDGIEELVRGCDYIPMIVDSKDNLYLASGEKGMVKCVLAE